MIGLYYNKHIIGLVYKIERLLKMYKNNHTGLKVIGGIVFLSFALFGLGKLLKTKKTQSENLEPHFGGVVENEDIDFINE